MLLNQVQTELSPASLAERRRRRLVMRLGEALHRYGTPAHRLENALAALAGRLGLEARFLALPTALHASFGPADDARVEIARVPPGSDDLGRLADCDALLGDLADGRVDPDAASERLTAIETGRDRYGALLMVTAHGVASAAAARFFGGGSHEIAAAAAIGLVAGAVARLLRAAPRAAPVQAALTAALSAFLACAAAALFAPTHPGLTALAGVIVLVPGFSLTTAMIEVATGHLGSGTSRLVAAGVQFFLIGFGVAVGQHAGLALWPHVADAPSPTDPPLATLALALGLAPLAFGVILQARPRDLPVIWLAGVGAFGGARLGAELLGAELGAAVGAALIGAGSNLYARIAHRPAAVPFVPGLLLLVPGSLGYRSFVALLDRDVIRGVETAFTMGLVAVSLVVGLLVAQVLVPPRHSL